MRQYSSCISLKFQIGIGIIINVDVFAIWGITLSSDFHILSISDLYIFLFNIWNHERSSYIFSCFVAAKVSPSAYRAPPSRGPPRNAIEVLSSFDSIGNFQFGVLKNGENPKINQWGKIYRTWGFSVFWFMLRFSKTTRCGWNFVGKYLDIYRNYCIPSLKPTSILPLKLGPNCHKFGSRIIFHSHHFQGQTCC